MSKRQRKRLALLNGMEMGSITAREAYQVLGLWLRHVRRILEAHIQFAALGCGEEVEFRHGYIAP